MGLLEEAALCSSRQAASGQGVRLRRPELVVCVCVWVSSGLTCVMVLAPPIEARPDYRLDASTSPGHTTPDCAHVVKRSREVIGRRCGFRGQEMVGGGRGSPSRFRSVVGAG